MTKPLVITSDVTIDLNGHDIQGGLFTESDGEITEGSTDSYAFWVKDGGKLTINGNGSVKTQPSTFSMAVWAQGGEVIINGGEFENTGNNCDLIYASAGGKVEIYGGKFIANLNEGAPGTANQYPALNIKDADRTISSIIVYGGSFFLFDPANNKSEGNNTSFVAEGYKSVASGKWYIVSQQ